MLSSPVYTEAHPRRNAAHAPSLLRARGRQNQPSANLFRMNTCRSVSKQTTLTIFRINTYEKHKGWGQLLLTRHPLKGVCPERPSGVKDLSCHPMRIAVLPAPSFSGSESAAADESKDLSPEFGIQMLKRSGECRGSGAGERGGARGFQKFLCVFADVAVAENGVARDQKFGAGANYIANHVQGNTAVHFNPERQSQRFAHFRESLYFVERARNEVLPAEPRIHGHHQHVVDHLQNFVNHVHRRGGVDDHGGLAPVRRNQLQRAMKMHAGFLVHGNPVRPGFSKGRNVVVGVFDHQVAVKDNVGKRFSERSHDGRPDGDVRHEVAVHYVHVKQSAAALERSFRIIGQPREVSGKNRGCEFNQRSAPCIRLWEHATSCSGKKHSEKTDYTRNVFDARGKVSGSGNLYLTAEAFQLRLK